MTRYTACSYRRTSLDPVTLAVEAETPEEAYSKARAAWYSTLTIGAHSESKDGSLWDLVDDPYDPVCLELIQVRVTATILREEVTIHDE